MATIKSVHGRTIIDSRANETLEVDVVLDDSTLGRASVPSGASTGRHEAYKIEDMAKSIENVQTLAAQLVGQDPVNQERIDLSMIEADGTDDKSVMGANVILAISLACADAAAKTQGKSLYEHIHQIANLKSTPSLPTPMFNIINGGKHADNNLEFQEFMVVPKLKEYPTIRRALPNESNKSKVILKSA